MVRCVFWHGTWIVYEVCLLWKSSQGSTFFNFLVISETVIFHFCPKIVNKKTSILYFYTRNIMCGWKSLLLLRYMLIAKYIPVFYQRRIFLFISNILSHWKLHLLWRMLPCWNVIYISNEIHGSDLVVTEYLGNQNNIG